MATKRISPPAHLPGATEFSADRELLSPLWLIQMMKQTQWLFAELDEATKLDKNWGRRKEPGSWALVFLAFVVSGQPDIEPWWTQTTPDLWQAAGFAARPSYQTTYERFVELESVSDKFLETAARLIQHAMKHEPRIGNHVHVDGTEAETHAALVHDCQSGEGCKWGGANAGQKPARTAERPRRVSTETAREQRHKDSAEAPDAPGTPDLGEADEVKVTPGGRLRVRSGQHWYRTLDASAGVRAYTGPRGARKFWHGFYHHKAIDHFTGAPLAVGVYSASEQEYDSYPDLYQRLQRSLAGNPQTVTADRGFSVASVFAWNTNHGVASVIPWRKGANRELRQDKLTHDRHGVPRCKHCGAPGRFVRFRAEGKGGPRLWFRCLNGTTPACGKDQSINCSNDWRLLVPLWRTEAIYCELKDSHSNYERVHRHWRDRYCVAGDNLACRPKRRGRDWQELRSQAALLIEWLTICFREGWLDSARRNKHSVKQDGSVGKKIARGFLAKRSRAGLNLPYGPKAQALGVGLAEMPSKRGHPPPGADPPDDGEVIPF